MTINGGNGPVVLEVSPPTGPTTGGTEVTITGTDLGDVDSARVDFGAGNPGTIISDDGSTIEVTSPPVSAVGAVDVTVTVAGDTSLINRPGDVFTYFSPLSLSPSFLPNATATDSLRTQYHRRWWYQRLQLRFQARQAAPCRRT